MIAENSERIWKEKSERLESELIDMIYINRAYRDLEMFNVDMPEHLQKFVVAMANAYDVPPGIPLLIGEHESGWKWPGSVMDSNGLPSIGYMQINEPHWQRLSDMGVDVSTEYGNIQGGIIILSELMEIYWHGDCTFEQVFVIYECGISGGQGIESTEFSRWMINKLSEV